MDHYILDNKRPVPAPDLLTWGRWFQTADRTVRREQIAPGVKVSTVFLGMDHRFGDAGPPLLFETMVFGGAHDEHQERCSTWEEAEQMHERVCAMVRT